MVALKEKLYMLEGSPNKLKLQKAIFTCIRDMLAVSSQETCIYSYGLGLISWTSYQDLASSDNDEMKVLYVDIFSSVIKSLILAYDIKNALNECGDLKKFVQIAKDLKENGGKALFVVHFYLANKISESKDIDVKEIISLAKSNSEDINIVRPCLYVLNDIGCKVLAEASFAVAIPDDDSKLKEICINIGISINNSKSSFAHFEESDFNQNDVCKSIRDFLIKHGKYKEEDVKKFVTVGPASTATFVECRKGDLEKIQEATLLNKAEIMAIYLYVMEQPDIAPYRAITKYIRETEKPEEDSCISKFFQSIRRLPKRHYDKLYRGQSGHYKLKGVTSASETMAVASSFIKGKEDPHIYELRDFDGYNISFMNQNEREVLTDPSMEAKECDCEQPTFVSGKIKVIPVMQKEGPTDRAAASTFDNFVYTVVRGLKYAATASGPDSKAICKIRDILNDVSLCKEDKIRFRHFGGFDYVFYLLEGATEETTIDALSSILKAFLVDDGKKKSYNHTFVHTFI